MRVDLAYLGHSAVTQTGNSTAVTFAPNLNRERVFFDAELADPIRFREAVSALHEVVVGDLRFRKRDKSAYLEWKKQEEESEIALRRELFNKAKKEELARISREPVPPGLEGDFRKMHGIYWTARRRWASELSQNDPALFRALVPCDPVVTVAPDTVLFECFAKDESSYGCLSVSRDSFRGDSAVALGTTNVDYSLALFEHFQTLRSYRPTRFLVDPAGFEVKVQGAGGWREEKIDLPPSWLRGFGQLQAATTLPFQRLTIPVEAMYSILAHLKRHREKSGPRSIRFVLTPGAEHQIVLDPWGVVIPCRGTKYLGEKPVEIKTWGRRRLMVLARLLPLADRIDVALLGSGLPSIWVVMMGNMRFTLALSGWTSNDWTSGSNLDLLAGSFDAPPADAVSRVAGALQQMRRASLAQLVSGETGDQKTVSAALHLLAKRGQLVFDFAEDVYRYREIMPFALSEELLGPENPELAGARAIAARHEVEILRTETLAATRVLYVAKAGGTSCEAILDADGKVGRAKCTCSYFFKNRLRSGPCRHLIALQMKTRESSRSESFLKPLGIRMS